MCENRFLFLTRMNLARVSLEIRNFDTRPRPCKLKKKKFMFFLWDYFVTNLEHGEHGGGGLVRRYQSRGEGEPGKFEFRRIYLRVSFGKSTCLQKSG